MVSDLPAFDEVHVVSDLHLGGRAGFQGFREGGRLANFIRRLAAERPEGQVALVLNGDVFDTLAEDLPGWIATDDARETVERIVRDPAFAPVWQALGDFVRRPGRHLVFVIGNHDLELALPAVQRLLLEVLAGGDLPARGRTRFSTVGGGFACRVGHCRVFCTHGNEVDPWNYNRYEDLATLVRRLNAGLSMAPSEWRPNAGTRLVKEVMNGVKRRHAWIDLLKPETSAAVGALLVLDPTQATKLLQLAVLMASAARQGRPDAGWRLSAAQEADGGGGRARRGGLPVDGAGPALLGPNLLGPNLAAALAMGASDPVDDDESDLLAVAERHLTDVPPRFERGSHPAFGPGPGSRSASDFGPFLGIPDRWRQRLQRLSPAEALRFALLDWLADDKSFDIAEPDETSRRLCASVDADIDFIVAGHTHLERAIDRGHGRAYFNTGTWMRLLRLTPAVLASHESFAPIWQVLADGRLQAIDEARTGGGEPLVMDRSGAVVIRSEPADAGGAGGRVVGELRHVEGDGSGEPRSIRRFVREPGPL